jgi:hypothetical protein
VPGVGVTRERVQAWLDAYRPYGEPYTDGRRFSNLFVLRFDVDGRCSEFVEWFIENPAGA